MTNISGLFFQITKKCGFSVFFPINSGTIVVAVVIIRRRTNIWEAL